MNFCSNCGSSNIHFIIPEGDNRARHVCGDCKRIHYRNPKIVVGCLPFYNGKLLLCKRDIEPQKGFWNLPAGFMENDETVEEGAMREVWEEAKARVELRQLWCIFNIVHVNQVYLLFLADMLDDKFEASMETADAQLFDLDNIPFDELAFNSNKFAIKKYLEDQDYKGVHIGNYHRTY